MTGWSAIIALGLVNHIATVIVVESEIFRPLRDWVSWHAAEASVRRMTADGPLPPGEHPLVPHPFWDKARYLVGCHMCVGVWVGIAEVCFSGARPLGGGFVGVILASLLVKALGHLVLELRPQAWPR